MKNIFDSGYFPDVSLAGEDGLLAVGGSLDIPVLLEAYSKGIFPWYTEGSPILWWSPDPRMVLFPDKLKVSRSLDQTLRKREYEILMDSRFQDVIRQCSKVHRPGQDGTWITREMIQAYNQLHKEGYAHSVEVFAGGELVGGLYGVSLGRAFFGESMFHLKRDVSKVALYHLVDFTRRHDFDLIDAQQSTPHLKSLGAKEIPRESFLALLQESISRDTLKGRWVL
ncbi:MAG: leucyl/phenylalanyl-tRNA--protein transferase [Bacteroides sp. SM23_62]|nr:MAG: leucyl/phenylalanyl-tRNA--protein transferase [Bacteroides sp. SM23_62]